jgi:hypothetical protein
VTIDFFISGALRDGCCDTRASITQAYLVDVETRRACAIAQYLQKNPGILQSRTATAALPIVSSPINRY